MRAILSIGYSHFLLPKSTKLEALLKALAEATEMARNFHDGEYYYQPETERIHEVNLSMVADKFIIDSKRKAIPEKASPDCHGEGLP